MELVLKLILFLVAFSKVSTEYVCGRSMHNTGLIVNGKDVKRGDWPFIAALFKTDGDGFFCAGTLITSQHVVTASHCMHPKYELTVRKASDVVVYLGKHNLDAMFERGSEPVYVKKIVVHPDWNFQTEEYDADISILVLESQVKYSNYIMAACWPFERTSFTQATIVRCSKSHSTGNQNIYFLLLRLAGEDPSIINLNIIQRKSS